MTCHTALACHTALDGTYVFDLIAERWQIKWVMAVLMAISKLSSVLAGLRPMRLSRLRNCAALVGALADIVAFMLRIGLARRSLAAV